MSEFKAATEPSDIDTTKAAARLPDLDIEIVHRRSPNAEQISITLQALPSFDAIGRWLETAKPFAFWAQAAQLAWLPWLEAARIAAPPQRLREAEKPPAPE